jgi:hypothetical protein
MNTCPAPNGSHLPEPHRPFLTRLLQTLTKNEFRQSKINPLLPQILAEFNQLCSTDEDLAAWCNELGLWVRWYRVPAFWLTFVFQLLTKSRGSVYHFLACELYSDAQTNFADDGALSSLETAYSGLLENSLVLGVAYEPVRLALENKLRAYYDYYSLWSRPFAFRECNPCADHLYFSLSQSWMAEGLPSEEKTFRITDVDDLSGIIAGSQTDDLAYYGILARRFLGLLHSSQGRYEASVEQFGLALEQARERRLDTEIGHLRRLLGCALRLTGKAEEARYHFEQALAFEKLEPFFVYTFYWQALSARELGDTIVSLAGPPADIRLDAPEDRAVYLNGSEKLKPALSAYHDGRLFLSGHMSVQCPFPLARAAKQQIFRSYSSNAIRIASFLQSSADVLAEVEWNGPREATELVTEIGAAHDLSQTELAEFRRNRALYYQTLNTSPARFEDYLTNIARYSAFRRAYLERSSALASRLVRSQACDEIVSQTLKLRLPETVFLLFHIGTTASTMVLLDMSSGLAAPYPLRFGEPQLRLIHREFETNLSTAGDAASKNQALEALLSRYADLLGPELESILPFLPGKHLKIFPRLQMNAVAFHAIRLQGKYLIEHCDAISYGQTLGLFLENNSTQTVHSDCDLRFVTGNNVPWYKFLPPKLSKTHAGFREEAQVSWSQLLDSISIQPARDTVFACHGRFDPEDVEESELELTESQPNGRVSFARVFEQLDLRGCRAVIMGACESGLARTEIAAEYIGLTPAMLSSGARYVIGSLWKIPQGATAVLLDAYLESVNSGSANICAAFSRAQRDLIHMTRDELAAWVEATLSGTADLDGATKNVAAMDERPFSNPYQWAGLQVVGDV